MEVTRLKSQRVRNCSSHQATLKSIMQKLGSIDFASSHFKSCTCFKNVFTFYAESSWIMQNSGKLFCQQCQSCLLGSVALNIKLLQLSNAVALKSWADAVIQIICSNNCQVLEKTSSLMIPLPEAIRKLNPGVETVLLPSTDITYQRMYLKQTLYVCM